jgi:hypothetical protein
MLDKIALTGSFEDGNDDGFEDEGDPFAFVPKEARGCMTNEEIDAALRDMCLSPAMENAVREVCRKGFVYAPGLKTKETVSQAQEEEAKDEHELEVDKRLADGDYHGVAFNAFLDILHAAQLLNSAIYQAHRVEHLTSIKCPDIVTTKQVEIARAKIEAAQNMLDTAERDLRKLQLKTDHRTDEQRLLDAVFGGKKREGGKRHEQ